MGLGVTKALEVLAPDTFRAWVRLDSETLRVSSTTPKFQVQFYDKWQKETRLTIAKCGKVSTKDSAAENALNLMRSLLDSPNPGVDKKLREHFQNVAPRQWRRIGGDRRSNWMDLEFTSMQRGEYEPIAPSPKFVY
jgi:hypothetical protein